MELLGISNRKKDKEENGEKGSYYGKEKLENGYSL